MCSKLLCPKKMMTPNQNKTNIEDNKNAKDLLQQDSAVSKQAKQKKTKGEKEVKMNIQISNEAKSEEKMKKAMRSTENKNRKQKRNANGFASKNTKSALSDGITINKGEPKMKTHKNVSNTSSVIEKINSLKINSSNAVHEQSKDSAIEIKNSTEMNEKKKEGENAETEKQKDMKDTPATNEPEKLENRRAAMLKNLLGKLQKTEDKLKVKLLDKLKVELKRTSDVARIEGASWECMNISESLIRYLEDNDFSYPSPVQVHTIPKALAGDDLLVRAKNGTGKTLSYVIPIIEMLTKMRDENTGNSKNFALVIVPTCELAMQIGKVFRKIGIYCKEAIMSTFGGSNYHEDILRIERGAGVIVGTPGRLSDLIVRNVIKLHKFRILVLDEADKILAKEFTDKIEQIVYKFNKNRIMPEIYDEQSYPENLIKKQMLLISATFPVEIFEFVRKHMNAAKEINLMPELHLKGLKVFYVKVDEERKLHCLKTILCKLNYQKLIIFCNSVVTTEKLGYRVLGMNFPCYYFHSKMSNVERRSIFHKFTTSSSEICALVATDLITRGIDVPEVNVVINFDLPRSVESFLHRIGRAGRFGTSGAIVNLCNEHEIDDLTWLEKQTGIQVKPISDPTFKDYTKPND